MPRRRVVAKREVLLRKAIFTGLTESRGDGRGFPSSGRAHGEGHFARCRVLAVYLQTDRIDRRVSAAYDRQGDREREEQNLAETCCHAREECVSCATLEHLYFWVLGHSPLLILI